jgi:putative PEP-CTERM system TPR-repeat lipoprotein
MLTACGHESADAQIASAKKYLAQNDPKAAYIQLKNALQQKPDLAEARFLLGKLMFEGGDLSPSAIELRKALDLNYPADAVVPLLAKALVATGDVKKLTDEFSATTLTSPEATADLQTSLAIAYAIQEDRDRAQLALKAAFAAVPDYVPALIVQARDLAEHQDSAGAFRALDTALAKAPDNHDVRLLEGDLLWHYKADVPGAVDAYKKAIAARRDSVAANAALVAISMSQGDLEAAKTELEGLRKVAPEHPRTKYLAARLAFQEGDYKRADDLVRPLLVATPADADVLELAGAAAFKQGSSSRAEQLLA